MAIIKITELARGKGTRESDGTVTYERTFHVYSDSVTESPDTIVEATGIPRVGDKYPGDRWCPVKTITPTQNTDNRTLWEVVVAYSNAKSDQSQTDRPIKPWMRPSKVSWSKYSMEEALVKDRDGNTILNSAGDLFNPPTKWERHFPVVRITRYQRNFDFNMLLDYLDHTNVYACTIAGFYVGVDRALMTNVEGTMVEVDGFNCWEVSYEIMFASSWKKEILNSGYYYLAWNEELTDLVRTRYTDPATNKPMETPALLNESGGLLEMPGGEPTYQSFDVYPQANFGPLGLN